MPVVKWQQQHYLSRIESQLKRASSKMFITRSMHNCNQRAYQSKCDGNQQHLEYDFVVAPGADPTAIKLALDGVRKMRVDARGDLVLRTAGGDVRWQQPIIYQEIDGVRRAVSGGYTVKAPRQVGFQVGAYDPSRPLTSILC